MRGRYTASMRSVADQLRDESRQRFLELAPAERVMLVLRLGDEDARLYAAAHHVSEETARLHLSRQRRLGRQPSASADR